MTFVGIGTWSAFVPMSILDRFGPKIISLIGMVLILVGYIMVGATASGDLNMSKNGVIFFGYIIGLGSSFPMAAASAVNTINTKPEHRGAVIGILQAHFSLGAGLYVQFREVFSTSVGLFLFILGGFMSLNVLVALPSTHMMNGGLKTHPLFILPIALVIVLLALLILVASFTDSWIIRDVVLGSFFIYMLVIIMVSVLMIYMYGSDVWTFQNHNLAKITEDSYEAPSCVSSLGLDMQQDGPSSVSSNSSEMSPLVQESINDAGISTDDDLCNKEMNKTQPEASFTLTEALSTIHFWLLFYVFAVGVGGGLTVLDNISWIVDSHSSGESNDDGVHETLKTNAVALFAAFNTITRVGYGIFSDSLRAKSGLSRAWLLCMNSLFFAATCLFMAYATLKSFSFIIIMAAISFGGFFALVLALAADLFGTAHYSSIYAVLFISPMIGTTLLFDVMSSTIYSDYKGDGRCYNNPACFKLTFLILFGLMLLASLASAVIAMFRVRT